MHPNWFRSTDQTVLRLAPAVWIGFLSQARDREQLFPLLIHCLSRKTKSIVKGKPHRHLLLMNIATMRCKRFNDSRWLHAECLWRSKGEPFSPGLNGEIKGPQNLGHSSKLIEVVHDCHFVSSGFERMVPRILRTMPGLMEGLWGIQC